MDHFKKASNERVPTPGDEDYDDVEEHEQIRLVETPDPVLFSSGDNSRKSIQTVDGIYHNLSVDVGQSKNGGNTHSQNEYYSHYLSSNHKESSKSDLFRRIWKKSTKKCSPKKWLFSVVPILSWLPKYNWKKDIAYDASAGFTVAVMNIPQRMAYALLSNVEPIVGLYMAFFPVIMYCILGTSRYVSVGTFAVICLMSGKVASDKAAYYADGKSGSVFTSAENETIVNVNYSYTTTEIAAALSLCVGLWQFVLGCFQLGSLSVLLSGELISGFTTGCAVHVLTSQMKNILGLKIARRTGIFKIPLTYADIALGIRSDTNITAMILSLTTIVILVCYNELMKPALSKRIPFPLPIELIVIIIGTLVSRYWITSSAYGIAIVDHIPTGLPDPTLPALEIVPDILVDGLIIAVVAYAISISMAKIFAIKHQYEVRPNQELIANGSSNIFGSFFSCAPISVSLSRSLIQEQVGGRTQVAGLFSCTIILFVLLWLAPFFETLPHCVLSSLIVVALKGMFMQVADFPKAWKESRINGSIWMISFLTTVFLDIEYGLVVGLLVTISSLLLTSNAFSVTVMGQHIHSHLFVEKKSDTAQVAEIPNVKILKLTGNMNFVNAETFLSKVTNILGDKEKQNLRKSVGNGYNPTFQHLAKPPFVTVLVLDFSSVSSVDPAAVKSIRELHDTQNKKGLQVLYAACPSNILQVMEHCKFFDHVNVQHFYPSIEHAVLPSSESPMEDTIIIDSELHNVLTPDHDNNLIAYNHRH